MVTVDMEVVVQLLRERWRHGYDGYGGARYVKM